MCNSRPVYRTGQALALQRVDAGGAPYGDLINLTGNQAVELGRKIIADEQVICDVLAEKYVDGVDGNLVELGEMRKKDGRLDFNYGVITDLQNMVFETDRYTHRTRMCVTVCQHGTRSKVWFRTQCTLRRASPDAAWEAPIRFDEEMLADYFKEASKLSQVALKALIEIYDERLQPYVSVDKDGDEAHLCVANNFEFKTFDTDNDKLPLLFQELKQGSSFTETLLENLEQGKPSKDPAMTVVNLAIPALEDEGRTDAEILEYMKNNDDFSIVDHASAYGDIGIFVQRSVSMHGSPAKNEFFAGVTYDPDAKDGDKAPAKSPAYRVAAEMLATVTDNI